MLTTGSPTVFSYVDDHTRSSVQKPLRIASFCGGGARGIIPAILCRELEKTSKLPIAELFDVFAAVSVGSIIAGALLIPDKDHPGKPANTAEKIVEFFREECSKIFPPMPWYKKPILLKSPEYSRDPLHAMLKKKFEGIPISHCLKDIIIPAAETKTGKPWWFTRSTVITDPRYSKVLPEDAQKVPLIDIIEATTAAPTYFEDKVISIGGKEYHFMDGGTFANNPSKRAVTYAESLYGKDQPAIVSCFGTGETALGIPGPHNCEGGILYWGQNFPSATLNLTSADTENEMRCLFPATGGEQNLFVFQPILSVEDDTIDDSTPAHMARLEERAKELIENQRDEINRFCEKAIIRKEV